MDSQNLETQPQPSPTATKVTVDTVDQQEPYSTLHQGKSTHAEQGKGWFYIGSFVEQRTDFLLHLLGYGLLLFALCDYLHILIPPRLRDPDWELQTIGALVEHAAIPLLGLILVFYRHTGRIREFERKLLGFLSWVALLIGLLYLLILPLGMADTWRIYFRNQEQISAQVSQQSQKFQQIKQQLHQAKTDAQIKQLLASSNPQGRVPKIEDPQELKNQFLGEVNQAEYNMQMQSKAVQQNQKVALLKNSLKWNLGALISATLFLSIWHLTRWVRKSRKSK